MNYTVRICQIILSYLIYSAVYNNNSINVIIVSDGKFVLLHNTHDKILLYHTYINYIYIYIICILKSFMYL